MRHGIRSHIAISIALCAGTLIAPADAAGEPQRLGGYRLDGELCGSYPQLPLGLRSGYCAGLVATEADGLKFPRSIIQIPGRDLFVVADMGGWAPSAGRLLLLDPSLPQGKRISTLLDRVDYPFGLAIGRDGKLYASNAQTIFRFDPLAPNPKATIETIVQGLPARNIALSDGTKVSESAHPFKQFVFDKTGKLYVNIGAPTDACLRGASAGKPCAAGEGVNPLAAIWAYTPSESGVFPALKPKDPNPPREIFARGLRNSMALAIHPDFPDAGFAFLQGENARDLPDPLKPNEEINALEKGKHYGWPYCYDLNTASPEFRAVLQSRTYKDFCNDKTAYRAPLTLMPPHSAPLGMLYYHGAKFPELEGKLVVGLHGYRPTGGRVIFYDVDAKGFPVVAPPPVTYQVSCAGDPTREFQTDSARQVAAAPFNELIAEWHKVLGVRPQGAPVGLAVASDGAIWLVEDKNKTVIRIDKTSAPPAPPLPCGNRTDKQIDEIADYVGKNRDNSARLRQIRTELIEKHCIACHASFGLKDRQSDAERDMAALRFMLGQDSWIYPGDPTAGRLHTRLRGLGGEKIMPPVSGEMLIKDQGYLALLNRIDQLVATMVPGQRMRVRGGRVDRVFVNRRGKACGTIPTGMVVVMVEKSARNKPGFSRIYRPADLYLNGDCSDDDGYYVEQNNLVPL